MPDFLIVDDSVTLRKMIMAALKPLNPIFHEAGNGLEAIEKLSLHVYDVVTLDLNMPDMHGLEFLHFIRNHSRLKEVPILVITTRGDEAMRGEVLAAGANGYMTKPFHPAELYATVLGLLKEKSM